MFSFHKPKIYRSLQGCCICRAKSSSSRFTDSKRYELDFERCFKISQRRAGEICNACVLLVKRWKKLPQGSTRNWHHVVDARAGPGTKSMYKIKCKSKENTEMDKVEKHKHQPKKHKHKKRPVLKPPQSPGGLSDDIVIGDEALSDDHFNNSHTPSPDNSDTSDEDVCTAISTGTTTTTTTRSHKSSVGSRRRKRLNPVPRRVSSFLDLTYWKQTEICCGTIFKGANGEVLLDTSLLRPCRACNKPSSAVGRQTLAASSPAVGRQTLASSDSLSGTSSVDSGVVMPASQADLMDDFPAALDSGDIAVDMDDEREDDDGEEEEDEILDELFDGDDDDDDDDNDQIVDDMDFDAGLSQSPRACDDDDDEEDEEDEEEEEEEPEDHMVPHLPMAPSLSSSSSFSSLDAPSLYNEHASVLDLSLAARKPSSSAIVRALTEATPMCIEV